jgi:hypothetical protein
MLRIMSSMLAALFFLVGFARAAASIDPLMKDLDSTETLSPGNLGDTGNMALPD